MGQSSLFNMAQDAGPKDQTNQGSFLSFTNSQIFREELILKNLKPYNIDGINSGPQGVTVYEQTLPDLSATEILFSFNKPGYPPIFRNDNPNAKVVSSTYQAIDIFKSQNPIGDNGPLSKDSYLAKIGSQVLQDLLLNNQAYYSEQELQNQNSINFKITTPDVNNTYEGNLSGTYFPASPIPGDYFLDGLNKRSTDSVGEVINLIAGRSTIIGGLFNGTLTRAITPSQIFLQNTSEGQKGVLFSNISYNIYRPAYGDSLVGGIGGNLLTTVINNLLDNFGLQLPGAYYVGSSISEPSFATTPINAVPIDVYGRDTQAIVLGPDVLGKDYEGNEGSLRFGLQSKSLINQGTIESDLIWVSPKYKTGNEELWSTKIDFKPGSVLDDTQRLIDSADSLQGEKRLKHVGNAINQASRIFHDGYKQITKGSQVKYVTYNSGKATVGTEYCRIFTKDSPYSTYDRLQKKDGIVTFGRKFNNSVLDSTYNLNIYPTKFTENEKPSWVGNGSVKKFMFSIENLAWKDSRRPGYSVQDLPLCERGSNGGRVMWFAPYDLKFSDNSSADWQSNVFLGRPEPVYTYRSTSRNGVLSWKIVVDHPSVLNLIVDKVLAGELDSNADQVIDSFFAGCQDYDLYELAAKFNTASLNDIQYLQEVIQRATPEEQILISESIPVVSTGEETVSTQVQNDIKTYDFNKFVGLGFYFNNDIPKIGSSESYENLYQSYISEKNTFISKTKQTPAESVSNFFDKIIINNYDRVSSGPNDPGLFLTIYNALENKAVKYIELVMEGSASAAASPEYNKALSQRRINSVLTYLETFTLSNGDSEISLAKYVDDGSIRLTSDAQGEGATNVTPIGIGSAVITSSCTEKPKINGQVLTDTEAIYVTDSMACRSVRIKSINAPQSDPTFRTEPTTTPTSKITSELPGPKLSIKPNSITETKRIPGLSKKVLRMLLSECNYFEAIKETNPFLYKSLKEKLKFFEPAFHSTTPEGLNSRLTFLNQCLRPGDTIPTIGTDGKPIYNDAINTAFGRPPVLVLRIGDFYNTKIIPRGIQFSYDPLILDMNREGIGIQPMIANVTMNFDFIGGSGLAGPIEELQNALSFNYYANTEIYDERATPTEDVSELDAIIAKSIEGREVKSNVNNIANQKQNPGGATIGKILTTESDGVIFSGTIDYKEFITNNLTELEVYYNLIPQLAKSVSESYNYYVWQYANCERKYTDGTLVSIDTKLYGSPKNLTDVFDKLIENVLSDVMQGNNTIIQDFVEKQFNDVVIRQVKQNLVDYIDQVIRPEFINELNQQLLPLFKSENNIITNIDKFNFVGSNYDGFIKTDGSTLIYNITGGTTYSGMVSDYSGISSNLNSFNGLINTENIVDEPSSFDSVYFYSTGFIIEKEEEMFFALMSKTFCDINNLQKLSDHLFPDGNKIGNVEITVPEPPKDFFDRIVGLRPVTTSDLRFSQTYYDRYNDAKKDLLKHIDAFITSNETYTKKYKKYSENNKVIDSRILTYSSSPEAPDNIKTNLQNLYKTVTTTGDKFNGKIL